MHHKAHFESFFAKIDLAANWALIKQHVPNYIFRDKVLFSKGKRSFFCCFFFFVESEAVVVKVEAEVEAVDGSAASTYLLTSYMVTIMEVMVA